MAALHSYAAVNGNHIYRSDSDLVAVAKMDFYKIADVHTGLVGSAKVGFATAPNRRQQSFVISALCLPAFCILRKGYTIPKYLGEVRQLRQRSNRDGEFTALGAAS